MKITDISENKKNKDRVSIFIDGKFATAVFKENAINHKLAIGLEMDQDKLIELVYEDEKQKGKDKAYQFLAFRARSCAEMKRKLLDKGYSEVIVDDIINELIERKILDDFEFAQDYSEQLLERGYGKRSIMAKLIEKRIDRNIIEDVLDQIDEESILDQARKYGQRIFSKYSREEIPIKRKQKFIMAMARHGYGFDLAKQIYDELFGDNNIEF